MQACPALHDGLHVPLAGQLQDSQTGNSVHVSHFRAMFSPALTHTHIPDRLQAECLHSS